MPSGELEPFPIPRCKQAGTLNVVGKSLFSVIKNKQGTSRRKIKNPVAATASVYSIPLLR